MEGEVLQELEQWCPYCQKVRTTPIKREWIKKDTVRYLEYCSICYHTLVLKHLVVPELRRTKKNDTTR